MFHPLVLLSSLVASKLGTPSSALIVPVDVRTTVDTVAMRSAIRIVTFAIVGVIIVVPIVTVAMIVIGVNSASPN